MKTETLQDGVGTTQWVALMTLYQCLGTGERVRFLKSTGCHCFWRSEVPESTVQWSVPDRD